MDHKSVLIVDDDETITLGLTCVLESDQVMVCTASTLEEVEMLLKIETFDLIITDLRLTGSVGLEGLDVISHIKKRTPQTPVVLLTAYGSPEIEQEAKRRGATEYWEKTIPIPTFIEKIRAFGIPIGCIPHHSVQREAPSGQGMGPSDF
jgi:DNA-binding NtrC family response regulator